MFRAVTVRIRLVTVVSNANSPDIPQAGNACQDKHSFTLPEPQALHP